MKEILEKIKNFSRKQKLWIAFWSFLNLILFILYVGPADSDILSAILLLIIMEVIIFAYYTRVLMMIINPIIWAIMYLLSFIGLSKKPNKQNTFEWSNSVMFAVIIATFLRSFFIEAYNIPTSSMERSMLVGDFLFVSKVNYGIRFPMNPLSFPLCITACRLSAVALT